VIEALRTGNRPFARNPEIMILDELAHGRDPGGVR
jgi:hypothetical protein